MIALCLQTCDRADYTARTIQSFAAHNDLSQFVLLHGDDASEDPAVGELTRAAGFTTVAQSVRRVGCRVLRTALFEAAAKKAAWILFLENDIETVRPFPSALFRYVTRTPEMYCLRLYGRFKDAHRREPCLATHKREQHQPVRWRAFRDAPEMSSVGRIHWSAQPAVTRSKELLKLHRTGEEPGGFTVRVKKNVTFHLGTERTPGRLL